MWSATGATRCLASFFWFFFFFNDTATTEIYTLSLHDALPIWSPASRSGCPPRPAGRCRPCTDRKSTRLNSSHDQISYAVFCLKKNKVQHRGNRISGGETRRTSGLLGVRAG